ncbi:MAG: NAD(+)--dinitrogen-reductase ADP-D-ribosyltransferase [Magnetococcales bacterium]|nr:NAD(+)--dinitrogen-reductase ADP-D-ribosyltransferase [Magnetococcales bacterium]
MRQIVEDCKRVDNLEGVYVRLPKKARSLINRTTLSPEALGSIAFQFHPIPLRLVGVLEMHKQLFDRLDKIETIKERTQQFMDYMAVAFRLESPEDAGYTPGKRQHRKKIDYLRILRGWLFNPEGRETAVLKGWVLSRFGLTPRFFQRAIDDYHGEAFQHFLAAQSAGLYNTNAIESQLDLLYHFCQYELDRRQEDTKLLTLYRGVNHIDQYEMLVKGPKSESIVLMNNLCSFSDDRERACEFGDYIMEVKVPQVKILFFHELFPGVFKGEGEWLVIGGLYRIKLSSY